MAEPVAMIGQTTFVRGNVRGQGSLTVAGRVEGNIEVDGDLVLEESSLVRCDAVTAQSVIARGAIAANITASESIVLEAGARVAGDLQAPKIRIEEGALFRGRIEMNGEARPQPTVRTARAAAPAQARPVAPPAAAPARVATPAPAPARAATPLPVRRAEPAPAPVAKPLPPARTQDDPRHAPAAPPPARPRFLSAPESAPERDNNPAPQGPPVPAIPALKRKVKGAIRKRGE